MAAREFSFTSESVTEGHPDKIADQVSDAVLDAVLTGDPTGRVACETLITTGLVVVAGEITTEIYVDIPRLVRKTIAGIGYTRAKYGFDAETCGVMVAIDEQSQDIAQGVDDSFEAQHGDEDPLDRVGAGDQGMMFGYASNETDELMPLPIQLAHKITKRLSEVRKADVLPYLRPDGKAQVTIRYEVDEHGRQRPVEIERILVSTQHRDGLDSEALIKPDLIEHVLHPILPPDLYDEKRLEQKDFVYVNPTGKFVIGGPMGDTGLTGRKIIVDTYGGAAPHGGGAFSGKDPTKVDRSAAYAARYVAKNVVAAGLAERCQIQVAYAIGVAQPLSVLVDTFGTEADGLTQDEDRAARPRALRPAPGRDPPRPRPAPPDLREDGRVRAFRPRGPRLHVGADGQGRRAAQGRRALPARNRLVPLAVSPHMAVAEPRRRFPTSLVALGVVVLTGFLFIGWAKDLIPGFGNPFGTETVDRSGPAVLKSIENLRDFRAASGHFEVIVDVEQDARFVPGKIKGERVLFVAIGSVDAGVDFTGPRGRGGRRLGRRKGRHARAPAGDVPRARARSRAVVRLRPRPRRDRPDPVALRGRRGVEQELYPLAQEKLATPPATARGCSHARNGTRG